MDALIDGLKFAAETLFPIYELSSRVLHPNFAATTAKEVVSQSFAVRRRQNKLNNETRRNSLPPRFFSPSRALSGCELLSADFFKLMEQILHGEVLFSSPRMSSTI